MRLGAGLGAVLSGCLVLVPLAGCGGAGAWLAGEPTQTAGARPAGSVPGLVGRGTWTGQISLATRPTFLVARTPEEWQALWDLVGQPVPGQLPDDLMALAIFIGTRTTGGYEVHITNVRMERRTGQRDRLLVEYRERNPDRDERTAQTLTSPYTIVLVDRTDATARYARVEERRGMTPG
ncbi:protease complex subunit PrcB family protein [Indioceanicola profundi]|uniref:protease complex subunit PrcB family protein n=1 Tax=Indioceanicola profundi TaxID=2220096 RepID=UPI0013C47054|nr:protease complex subunit PrcB family protein [Indioceanicola profundi]